MNADATTLLISTRHTVDNQLLWRAAVRRGWSVERVRGLNLPDGLSGRILLYLESLFAPTVARRLGLSLLQTPEAWLPGLPAEYRLREIALTTLGEASQWTFPLFVKPPNDKSFPAQVHDSLDSLPREYDASTSVLIAAPVNWLVEFRCFCLDGQVRTLSPYMRLGRVCGPDEFQATASERRQAADFAERVSHDGRITMPRAIVLDVGVIASRGWAVVEANAAWGSGTYGCDPDEVLNVLEHATEPNHDRIR